MAAEELTRGLAALEPFGERADTLRGLAELIVHRKA
jgi:hypothetical protein